MVERKTILFFPTAACRNADGGIRVPVHGWIYRPTEVSRLRRAGLAVARRWVKLRHRVRGEALALFSERFGLFLADNERGERIIVSLGGREFRLKKSRADGHFRDDINVELGKQVQEGWLRFSGRLGEGKVLEGRALLLAEEGVSVVSDIDDTVKITDVGSRRELLRNTFGRPFACVPEMAGVYRQWAAAGAAFHYVSGSPWHLYPALADFFERQGFPEGTWHLRDFRLAGIGLATALRSSYAVKRKHLVELMTCYPRREFVLVGDSGESDARLYAEMVKHFPRRVRHVFIRDIGAGEGWRRWLEGLPQEVWTVFRHAGELAKGQTARVCASMAVSSRPLKNSAGERG